MTRLIAAVLLRCVHATLVDACTRRAYTVGQLLVTNGPEQEGSSPCLSWRHRPRADFWGYSPAPSRPRSCATPPCCCIPRGPHPGRWCGGPRGARRWRSCRESSIKVSFCPGSRLRHAAPQGLSTSSRSALQTKMPARDAPAWRATGTAVNVGAALAIGDVHSVALWRMVVHQISAPRIVGLVPVPGNIRIPVPTSTCANTTRIAHDAFAPAGA